MAPNASQTSTYLSHFSSCGASSAAALLLQETDHASFCKHLFASFFRHCANSADGNTHNHIIQLANLYTSLTLNSVCCMTETYSTLYDCTTMFVNWYVLSFSRAPIHYSQRTSLHAEVESPTVQSPTVQSCFVMYDILFLFKIFSGALTSPTFATMDTSEFGANFSISLTLETFTQAAGCTIVLSTVIFLGDFSTFIQPEATISYSPDLLLH